MKAHRSLRVDAERIWAKGLKAVDPEAAVRAFVKRSGRSLRIGNRQFDLSGIPAVWALGAGKAAASMASALEKTLGKYITGGIAVTKYGHSLSLGKIEVVEAGHPLPDANGVAGGSRMMSLIDTRIHTGDLVICLLSGGGSALLVAPAEGISLEEKLECTRQLLNCGATIHELNTIRKHLSRLKGGGLARLLAGKDTVSLIISDVVGDALDTIASGPLVPDNSTYLDCLEILRKYGLLERVPASIKDRLELGAARQIPETPKPGNPIFRKTANFIVAGNALACEAAAREARRLGYKVMILTTRLEGDTAEAAHFHMSIAEDIVFRGKPLRRPACVISGGETTVKVTGNGQGGRNQEFALHSVQRIARLPAPCIVASVGTDGTDGPTDAAGAVADNTTLTRSLKFGPGFLQETEANNDSYNFFRRLDDLILTGPTRTNVADLRIILIG